MKKIKFELEVTLHEEDHDNQLEVDLYAKGSEQHFRESSINPIMKGLGSQMSRPPLGVIYGKIGAAINQEMGWDNEN